MGEAGLIGELGEILTAHGLLYGVGRSQKVLQIAIFADQLGCGLHPDLRYSGNVVRGISGQRHYMGYPLRSHTPLLLDLGGMEPLILAGIQNGYVVVHQLHHILVPGDDDHIHPGFYPSLRHGAQNVVGLIARKLEHGNVEGGHRLVDQGNLWLQLFGHGLTVGLVVGVKIVTKGRTLDVEDDGQIIRLLLLNHLLQHLDETKNGVGGKTVAPGHVTNAVEGPEDVAGTVDQIEPFFIGCKRGVSHFQISNQINFAAKCGTILPRMSYEV